MFNIVLYPAQNRRSVQYCSSADRDILAGGWPDIKSYLPSETAVPDASESSMDEAASQASPVGPILYRHPFFPGVPWRQIPHPVSQHESGPNYLQFGLLRRTGECLLNIRNRKDPLMSNCDHRSDHY